MYAFSIRSRNWYWLPHVTRTIETDESEFEKSAYQINTTAKKINNTAQKIIFSLFRLNFVQVREQDECILANLKQYNCDKSYVDVLVSDFSNSIWHKNIQFDRIITDRKWNFEKKYSQQ